nr:MAG TPA: hypothetical protein [Caudoviricetes sp.]
MTFATKNKELLDLFRLSGKPVPHEDSNMGRAVSILTTIIDNHSHSITDADDMSEEMKNELCADGWSIFTGNASCNPYAECTLLPRADGDDLCSILATAYGIAGMHIDEPAEFEALRELETMIAEGIDDNQFEFDGNEYRLIKSDEDVIWPIYRDAIQNLVKDCYSDVLKLDDIPSFIAVSVDWEQTAKNAYADGYGHQFSSYDGSEYEAGGYYIFRTN